MENNKKIEIDVDNLFRQTYNRIAKWHNDDATGDGLKLITHLIIDSSMETFFKSLDLSYNLEINMDDAMRKKVNEIKKSESDFLT
jgi:hypothetical protein